jgi:hypothetical protein
VLGRPAVFLKDVLNVDQFARVFGDVKANRVGRGAWRELFASMASKPKIADFAHARLIGLSRVSGCAAKARERVA